jgi:N-acetylglucosaminyl-diphospho-decaprenol L-rhamnosyltransferase
MTSTVDVVVVAYQAQDRLRRCLESLRDYPHSSRPLRVVVVDNGDEATTASLVHGVLPEADVLEPHENLGFARATNLGIRSGSGEYILVLNPDTEVLSETLDRVLAVLDARPDVAIVGPKLVRADGSLDHAARRSFPTPLSALAHFAGIGRLLRGGPLAQYRAPEVESGAVDAVNGAFMLIRRSALEAVGLFDEGYWMYMEDLDLCYRLRQAGGITWYEPAAEALHVKHGTTGAFRSPRLVWAFHYGMYRFYRKHYAPRRNAALSALVYVGIAGRALGTLLVSVVARPAITLGGPRRRLRESRTRV